MRFTHDMHARRPTNDGVWRMAPEQRRLVPDLGDIKVSSRIKPPASTVSRPKTTPSDR